MTDKPDTTDTGTTHFGFQTVDETEKAGRCMASSPMSPAATT
jgi:hypothetical protein